MTYDPGIQYTIPVLLLPSVTQNVLYSAEKAVNDRLAHSPELYLLALAQFAIAADQEVVSQSHSSPER